MLYVLQDHLNSSAIADRPHNTRLYTALNTQLRALRGAASPPLVPPAKLISAHRRVTPKMHVPCARRMGYSAWRHGGTQRGLSRLKAKELLHAVGCIGTI